MTGDAGDIDDSARTLPAHDGNHGLHELDGAEKVRFEKLPVLRNGHVLDGIHEPEACVVHKDVNAAEGGERRFDQGFDLRRNCYIASERDTPLEVSETQASGFSPLRI